MEAQANDEVECLLASEWKKRATELEALTAFLAYVGCQSTLRITINMEERTTTLAMEAAGVAKQILEEPDATQTTTDLLLDVVNYLRDVSELYSASKLAHVCIARLAADYAKGETPDHLRKEVPESDVEGIFEAWRQFLPTYLKRGGYQE